MEKVGKPGAVVVALCCGLLAAEETPWYELKDKPGANLHAIKQAMEAERETEEADRARDLTRYLLPEGYENEEEEEDFHFQRWVYLVESRVEPSGDLGLLRVGQEEMLKTLPLNGRASPPLNGNWEPLGPNAANTAGAGRINWISFHPTDNNSYLVGSPGGGLWITKDAGASWTPLTDRIASLGAAWAEFHPADPNIIYLATGDHHNESKSIGVLKSTDGGATWNSTGLTFPISGSTQIEKMIVDPNNPNRILVGASNGVHVSTDGGATFKLATGTSGKIWDVEIHPTDPNIVYASSTNFYVSTNGGNSFTSASGLAAAGNRMLIAVTRAQPDWVYVLRGDRGATQGVHKSIDAGKSFSQTGTGAAIGCGQVWYDYSFDAHPAKPDELVGACMTSFRSTDGGASWTSTGSGPHAGHPWHHLPQGRHPFPDQRRRGLAPQRDGLAKPQQQPEHRAKLPDRGFQG